MFAHLYELLRSRAAAYPASVAIGSQDGLIWRTLSSRTLLERVDRLADELAVAGVVEGDRVVLWVPNHWRTPVYLFAVWKLGAIVVPFDREMNPEGGARILASVEPRLIVVGYGERPTWARQVEVVEWWEPGSRGAPARSTAWQRPAETLAALMFTSGTTGSPKGCMISHQNLCSQVEAVAERVPLDTTCRLASVLPLSHLLELTSELYALSTGAAVHYVANRRGPEVVRVLSEQRITHMIVVPQVLIMMGRTLEQQLAASVPPAVLRALYRLAPRLPFQARRWLFWPVHNKLGGQLRLMLSGGAALPDATQLLWERLGLRVVQGYGTSECSPVVTMGTPDGKPPLGSVGRPLRGVELKLNPDGELLVRGPNVMRGYWKNPERTAEVLQDGWYATGDLAEIDSDGYVRIVGRARDLIALPSGMKVWPEDVEDVLRQDPGVRDAAIIAVPTLGGGAQLHAYLLPAAGAAGAADLAAIVSAANGRLAAHQRITSVSWYPAPDFPRTTMLKLRRHLLLRPDEAAVAVESTMAADDPVGQAIAGVAHLVAVQADQRLDQLGLDSLGLVELAVALEGKTGKSVADGALRLEMNVEQVRGLVASAPRLDAAGPGPRPGASERVMTAVPDWPYTWGRVFRLLDFPVDLLFKLAVTRTIVLGPDHLVDLPSRVIFAGTHHGFPDMPLVRHALAHSPARRLAGRLVVPIAAGGFGSGGMQLGLGLGLYPWYGIVAFGLYPLRQLVDQDVSLRRLAHLAQLGNPILIFPQGTHAQPEEERRDEPRVRFRPGVAHLARALDAVVVPFGLAGTECLMAADPVSFEGRKVAGVPISLQRGPLAIAFAAPLQPRPEETPQAFAARLQTTSYELTRRAERALAGEPDGKIEAQAV